MRNQVSQRPAKPLPANSRHEAGPLRADIALVAVHGMGRQRQAQTLLEWAEPLLGRIDWLTTRAESPSRAEIDQNRLGVTIDRASLTSSPQASVIVTARWLTAEQVKEQRIAVVEARWSESFAPMTRADVFQWGARFLWRSLIRMFWHFTRIMLEVPWVTLVASSPGHVTAGSVARRVLAVPMVFAGLLFSAIAFAVLAGLGLLGSLLLTLLSPLLIIPGVKKLLQVGVDVLVDFVGDVGTFRSKPLRAAAMGDVLVDALDRACGLLKPEGQISVLAHSQGAAIAAKVLFRDLDLTEIPVTRLATIGAAITLLGTTAWQRTPAENSRYGPVENWVHNAPHVTWNNYWAVWDPFSAGPVGDSSRDRRRRWRACYGRDQAGAVTAAPYCPTEHAVHNTSSPLTDHQSYGRNTLQVVEPIARELLGQEFVASEQDQLARATRETQVVRLRRARGATLVATIVAAVLLPQLDGLRGTLSALIELMISGVNSVTGLVGLSAIVAPTAGPLGTAVLIVVFAAVLIWLNARFFDWAEQRLVWQGRTPAQQKYGVGALERGVSVLAILVQLAFVGGAAAAALLLTAQSGAELPGGLPALAAGLGALVGLVLLAVRWGKLPQPAPGHQPPASQAPPPGAVDGVAARVSDVAR